MKLPLLHCLLGPLQGRLNLFHLHAQATFAFPGSAKQGRHCDCMQQPDEKEGGPHCLGEKAMDSLGRPRL